jgi:hypothetical protein
MADATTITGTYTPTITTTNGTGTTPTIDYDKIASILDGKMKVTEESVLKGYFKNQGLTGDEMSQAIEMFKKDKASREPDVNALNQKITDANTALEKANKARLMAETKVEAMMMASELGVEQKVVPYLLKMADLSSVVTDGNIDNEKLKESLGNVLKDIPQLKLDAEEKPNGFKIGADTSKQTVGQNDELARIFGVKMK